MVNRLDNLFVYDAIEDLEGDDPACQGIRGATDDDLEIVVVAMSPFVAAFSEPLAVNYRVPCSAG